MLLSSEFTSNYEDLRRNTDQNNEKNSQFLNYQKAKDKVKEEMNNN